MRPEAAISDATRKLATIVALDVAGYSARTEADEAKTTAEVAALRTVIEAIAARHGGRVFNTAGDGFMLEFASSLAAVEAAFALAETCEPKVRVGVHLGDVVVQPNGDLLGHGVNVAARLMARAAPGSALVSADVQRTIRGPLAQTLRSQGALKLDKMAETIEVFAAVSDARPRTRFSARLKSLWTLARSRQAAIAGAALLLLAAIGWTVFSPPSPPQDALRQASLAVLPFENLSADKDNAFFASGIQDEILTRLTKIGSLKVISRTSTAHLVSRPNNLPELAKQLGVATILEGSVQRDGNAVRVNVQLIDAATDTHVWAEIYDRKLDDIFSVQSEIAIAIAEALNAKVTRREEQTLKRVSTTSSAAYDAYLRALALSDLTSKGDPDVDLRIDQHLAEAVRLDPQFAIAWALSARNHAWKYFTTDITEARRAAALGALERAVRFGPDLEEVLLEQGRVQYWIERDYEGARQHFERLVVRWPNNPQIRLMLAAIAKRKGRFDESKNYLRQAVQLDPRSFDVRFDQIVLDNATRDFAEAIRECDAALNIWPDDAVLVSSKITALQSLGRLDDAEALLRSLRPQSNDGTIDAVIAQAIYRRSYAAAIRTLKTLIAADEAAGSIGLSSAYSNQSLGYLLALSGDAAGARVAYAKARDEFASGLKTQPQSTLLMNALAFVSIGLGEREAAIAYAAEGLRLMPIAKDALAGAMNEDIQMRVWARFGDRDHAIPAIARLLKLPAPYPLTPAILRLDPDFDQLRGDPRFEALAAEGAKATP